MIGRCDNALEHYSVEAVLRINVRFNTIIRKLALGA